MAAAISKNLPEASNADEYIQLHSFDTATMAGRASAVIKGSRGTGTANSWRHLVIHEPSGTKLWFDLGISEDLSQYTPFVRETLHKIFGVKPGTNSILDDLESLKIDAKSVKYIVPSHAHWDHVYPVGSFFPNATLLCGPGTLHLASESWPEHPQSQFDSRVWNPKKSTIPIQELPHPSKEPRKWQSIGTFEHGHDLFGDGSFWLIRAPGHCEGNLIALARTKNKANQRRWVVLAGDVAHSYNLLRYPDAPFGEGIPINASGTLHVDPEAARKVLHQLHDMKRAYDNEMFIWPAHVDSPEGMWEF